MNQVEKFLIIANISKRNNVKYLINTAFAYHFHILFITSDINNQCIDDILNEEKDNLCDHNDNNCVICNKDSLFSSKYQLFLSFDELKSYLNNNNIPIVGIEICNNAISIEEYQFTNSIAFMPGKFKCMKI